MIWYPISVAVLGIANMTAFLLLGRLEFAPCSTRKPGRHRAQGRVSWLREYRLHAQTTASRAHRAAFLSLMVIPEQDEIGEWIAAMHATESDEFTGPPVGGLGRYAHLRPAELDSTAERFYRLVELGIRPPSPWGTPELDDVWEPAMAGAR